MVKSQHKLFGIEEKAKKKNWRKTTTANKHKKFKDKNKRLRQQQVYNLCIKQNYNDADYNDDDEEDDDDDRKDAKGFIKSLQKVLIKHLTVNTRYSDTW